MLREGTITKLVCSILVFGAAMPAAMSQTGVPRSAISAQRIVGAMASAGITVSPGQIELLSGTSLARESTSVRVESVSNGTGGVIKVKLRCQDNLDCLPFYVLVHGLDEARVGGRKVRAVPGVVPSSPQNIIRGGDHATLIIETPDSRMTFPVICLQSGMRGQKIRVASPDHRQFYDAEVIATGILKGSL